MIERGLLFWRGEEATVQCKGRQGNEGSERWGGEGRARQGTTVRVCTVRARQCATSCRGVRLLLFLHLVLAQCS